MKKILERHKLPKLIQEEISNPNGSTSKGISLKERARWPRNKMDSLINYI